MGLRMSLRLGIQRGLILALGGVGLVWGGIALPTSEAADDFRYFESRLLQSETYSPKTLTLKLASPAALVLSDCDSDSQTALLLMEMRLAQTALRAGDVAEFDKRAGSLETRAKRALSCTPRQSFIWLLLFSLDVLHGRLNQQAFDLLATSYETAPNEGWIAIRRTILAMPLVQLTAEPLQEQIIGEFQQLVQNGFVHEAALSYSTASASIRALLQARIERLDARQQKAFWDETEKIRS
jgi:hypothetical protein